MRIGVAIEETWSFFQEVYDEFQRLHQTALFRRRSLHSPILEEQLNNYFFHRDLKAFLGNNQVVFFEWASDLLVYASRLPKVCGIVTRLHRYELNQFAERINWDNVDKVILVSQAKKREFSQRFPNQEQKAVVVPEAISLAKFVPLRKEFNGDIGILCNLTPRKRVYELILAFHELLSRRSGYRLHIGGGRHVRFGDYYLAVHDLVERLGLQDQVTLYGRVSDPENWYRNVDIFISNSYSEGLQVSPMEAIASGCYCLCHNWDGADELLPVGSRYDTDYQLVKKILSYADSSPQDRQALWEEQCAIIRERFDVDRTKVAIRQLVEEVGALWR